MPGLFAIHEALGSLPMGRLVEHAVATARAGWSVTRMQLEAGRMDDVFRAITQDADSDRHREEAA